MSENPIYATFTGGLGLFYLHGVPARDLTREEYEKYRAVIEACPAELYKVMPEDDSTGEDREGENDAAGEL